MESLSTKWKQLISTCRDGLLSQRVNKAPKGQSGHLVALSPLFGRPFPFMPGLLSHPRTTTSPLESQKTSTELSHEFDRDAVTVPVKKDRPAP